MKVIELLKFLAGLSGAILFGISILVVFHYMRMPKSVRGKMQVYFVMIVVSYGFMIAATIRSVFLEAYPTHDIWWWLVILGYGIGIASWIPIFKYIVKKREHEKLSEYIKKQQKNDL